MVWDLFVNLFQDGAVQLRTVQLNFKYFYFCHDFSGNKVHRCRCDLVAPEDHLDLVDEDAFQSRCDREVLIKFLLWNPLVEFRRFR